jgi:hypothetical protein
MRFVAASVAASDTRPVTVASKPSRRDRSAATRRAAGTWLASSTHTDVVSRMSGARGFTSIA